MSSIRHIALWQFTFGDGYVDNFGGLGKLSQITGRDGIVRTKIELEGGYNSKEGIFEWLIEADGTVNHRLFIPKD